MRVADDFESGELDTSIWSVGWGWGKQTTQGSMYTDERAISVQDSVLELSILNEPDTYPVGAVNTKNKETIGPGTYVEARTRSSNLPGTTSNFWSKPNSESWPPEIDFKETPIREEGDITRSTHHIHWTTDGEPNGPHADYNAGSHDAGYDLSENWTTYGCRWLQDSVTYYINGVEHARVTDPDVMESVNNGAPFYVMLDLMNWPGPDLLPSDFSGYDAVHEVDWVRIWDLDSQDADSGTSTDTQPGDHYIWFRSGDGSEASFIFTASGGNIQLDGSDQPADYTIGEDAGTAWGSVEKTSSLPGFWYDGEIADFAYSGSLDVFVDNERVDPASLRDTDTAGPFRPTDQPRTVTVDGTDSTAASYRINVTGDIESRQPLVDDSRIYSYSWLDETIATGRVDGEADAFGFSGDISSLHVNGEANVRIDGKTAELVRIEAGSDSDDRVAYLVETTGSLVPADLSDGTHPDRVGNGKAYGSVDDEVDTFWLIDGEVTDVSTFGGRVTATVDGTEVS